MCCEPRRCCASAFCSSAGCARVASAHRSWEHPQQRAAESPLVSLGGAGKPVAGGAALPLVVGCRAAGCARAALFVQQWFLRPRQHTRTGQRPTPAAKTTGLRTLPQKGKTQKASVETCCRRCRCLCVLSASRRGQRPPLFPTGRAAASAVGVGKGQATGSVAFTTTGRRVSRSSFCGESVLLPVLLALLPGLSGLFLCGASGRTCLCRRQPTVETPGRRGCRAW